MMHKDVLTPDIYQVQSIRNDTSDVFTLTLTPKEKGKKFSFLPGQFNMVYHFGFGEIPLSITGDPGNSEILVHTVRAVGPVSCAMQKLQPGDEVGIRGPFGTSWPLHQKEFDIFVIAGGMGLVPLSPAVLQLLAHKNQYCDMTLLYGVKAPHEIIYKNALEIWQEQGIKVDITVDKADASWKGNVGVVTPFIKKNIKNPKKTLIFMCGPEIMFRFAAKEVLEAGVEENNIYLSLERNMQCGVGFCGRCQLGPYFVCKDGPVFSYAQVKKWLIIKEL